MYKNNLLFYSRCLLAILAVLGTTIQLFKHGFGMMMNYPVQSNGLDSIFGSYMVVAMQQNKNLQSTKF
ncbi:MAG: hypothetical protein Q4D67_07900, partial [Streptococcus minor]|nr:hypothetical protein [Streptococcus minor]